MENITEIANIDAIANAIDNSNEGFFFVPWIGKNYKKGLNEKKVLVVGASHYCNHSNICTHSELLLSGKTQKSIKILPEAP